MVFGKGVVVAAMVVIYGILLHREISSVLASATEAERIGNLMFASGVGLLTTFVLLMAVVWLFSGVKEERSRAKRS